VEQAAFYIIMQILRNLHIQLAKLADHNYGAGLQVHEGNKLKVPFNFLAKAGSPPLEKGWPKPVPPFEKGG